MNDAAAFWETLLRGAAIGALTATAIAAWRGDVRRDAKLAVSLLAASVIAYVLQSSESYAAAAGGAGAVTQVLALGGGGLFWLLIAVLFDDQRVTARSLAPAALLTLIGCSAVVIPHPEHEPIWIAHNLIEAGFALHALAIVAEGWRGDLVEPRRRLRGPFLGVVGFYVVVLSALEIGESFGVRADWYDLAGAAMLAALSLTGVGVFVQIAPDLFGARAQAAAAAPALDAGDRLIVERLETLMSGDEIWRREGLSIGALAEALGVPEHRLRALINDQLGHRNFAAFINQRRIAAAQAALSDPARALAPISVIAFELGFGSLGPFNRAFKDTTGQTPSEWRRRALESGSPNPENPRRN